MFLLDFTGFVLGFTAVYWVCIGIHRRFYGFTGFYWVSLDLNGFLIGLTGR